MDVAEALAKKERVSLGFFPTPLMKLERLSRLLEINLYMKRDDFTGQNLFGGNKIRKLEYIMGKAKAEGAEYVFTYGATQSNHAMQTVSACCKLGMKPVLFLTAIVKSEDYFGNLLLDKIMGAEIHIVNLEEGENEQDGMRRTFHQGHEYRRKLEAEGHKCFDVPMGGAVKEGSAAFIGGYEELENQLKGIGIHADYLFHATGTGGTMAGLAAGRKLLLSDTEIISVQVGPNKETFAQENADLGNDALEWLGFDRILTAGDIHLEGNYYYPGYEQPNEKATEAIQLTANQEGILLDPVYSGKAMAGLIDYVRTGKIAKGSNVVFWHTGGTTALFAEKEILGGLIETV